MMKYAGNEVKANVSVISQALSAGATNGSVVDRRGYLSGVINANVGDVDAGTLTSVVFKIQHGAASNGSDMADVSSTLLATSSVTVAAINTAGTLSMDLRGLKRYVRIVATATIAGGASTINAACGVILGNKKYEPVT